jgi:hypothetical protein
MFHISVKDRSMAEAVWSRDSHRRDLGLLIESIPFSQQPLVDKQIIRQEIKCLKNMFMYFHDKSSDNVGIDYHAS